MSPVSALKKLQKTDHLSLITPIKISRVHISQGKFKVGDRWAPGLVSMVIVRENLRFCPQPDKKILNSLPPLIWKEYP